MSGLSVTLPWARCQWVPRVRTVRRMSETARDQLNSFLHGADRAIWSTAAVVLAIRGAPSEEQQAAAQAVLTARALLR